MALVGWWQLDGNINDSSPYKWGSRSPSGIPVYHNAPIGQGLNHAGGGADAAVHTKLPSSLLENGSLTISFWLRQHSGHSTPENYLFGFGSMYMSHGETSSLWTLTSDYLQDITDETLTSTVSFTDDQWYHVCIVRNDTGTLYIYVDGELSDTDTANDFIQWEPAGENFAIGALQSGSTTGEATQVQHADWKIFNHELSIKEIKELAKGKMFHVDFEDSVDNIAGRVLTGSRAANTGYYHTGTGSNDDFIVRVGDSMYFANGQTNALTYDGTNKVIQYDQSASGHTFAFWINEKDFTSPVIQNPFSKAWGGEGELVLEEDAGQYYEFKWGPTGSNNIPNSIVQSPDGMHEDDVWHHTVIVRDPSSESIIWYLDGELQSVETPDTWYAAKAGTLDFYLFDGDDNDLNGYLDDFRIYATTLSQYDIKELYQTKAYLTNYGNFIAKGNVSETDFYYGFNGYISDTIAFDVNLGAGSIWVWGEPTGSREALRVHKSLAGWTSNITTKRKFNRPSVFYGSVQMESNAKVIVGWKDNGTGSADTDYVHSLIFNNTAGILSVSEDGSVLSPTTAIYLSESIWYDFKMSLVFNTCTYQYKDPQVHKEWQDITLGIHGAKTENTLRPAFTLFDGDLGQTKKSWHDNWAVSALDSQVTYYGNIISNEINEVGITDNLKAMWSLDFTTASYTSTGGNIYVLTSSAGAPSPIYGMGPDRINGCALLNWTGSDGVERLNHNIINFENGSEWTAMCWIYPSESFNEFDMLGLSASAAKTLGTDANGRLFYQHTGSTVTDNAGLFIAAGQWNHIAWSHSTTNIFMMIDGEEGQAAQASSPSCSFNSIGMGGNATAQIFQGKVSDVRIYDISLSKAEITQIYHLSKPTGSLMASGSDLTSVYLSRDFIEGY